MATLFTAGWFLVVYATSDRPTTIWGPFMNPEDCELVRAAATHSDVSRYQGRCVQLTGRKA
jgi:murein tripeptide amidase MpaA